MIEAVHYRHYGQGFGDAEDFVAVVLQTRFDYRAPKRPRPFDRFLAARFRSNMVAFERDFHGSGHRPTPLHSCAQVLQYSE